MVMMPDNEMMKRKGEYRDNPRKSWPMSKTQKTLFIDQGNYEQRAMAILDHQGNLRLNGDTGVGKSTFVNYLCEKYDWELHEYQLSSDTSRFDLLAQTTISYDEKKNTTVTDIRPGVILQWLLLPKDPSKRQVLFLDEYNYAPASASTLLNSIADDRARIFVPELYDYHGRFVQKDSPIKMDPNSGFDPQNPVISRQKFADGTMKHIIIIAMNPGEKKEYVGASSMNVAQLRRYESIEIEYLTRDGEFAIIKKFYDVINEGEKPKPGHRSIMKSDVNELLDIAMNIRGAYKWGIISIPLTSRNLLNYCEFISEFGMDMKTIKMYIADMYPSNMKEMVTALLNKDVSNISELEKYKKVKKADVKLV